MDAKRLGKIRRRIATQMPLIGSWLRRSAARSLARDGSPEAIRLLAETIANTGDESLRTLALRALRGLKAQPSIDEVCAVWVSSRHSVLEDLLTETAWVALLPKPVHVLTALKAGRSDLILDMGSVGVEALIEACNDRDPRLSATARGFLPQFRDPEAIDAICLHWANGRQSLLAEAIIRGNFTARQPPNVHVLSALKTGKIDILTGGSAEVVEPLLQACRDVDETVSERAFEALHQLRSSAAKEALCGLVIRHEHPLAREIVLAAQYAPSDSTARALFYFLTEQWEKYQSLDFDQSLLGSAYEAGDKKLRCRIAEKARRAGRTEWISVIAGSRQERRANELTEEEWEAALAVLTESKRWPEMWRLAQAAPPNWSVRFLNRLAENQWVPSAERDREGFRNFVTMAQACAQEPPFLGRLMRCAAPLEGHGDHVSCFVLSRDGRTMVSGSNDRTLRVWNVDEGTLLRTLEGHTDWIACLALTSDEFLLASGSRDGTIGLWSFPEGRLIKKLDGHSEDIRCLAFSPDGHVLATGGADKTIRLWRMPDGHPMATLTAHSDIVSCLGVSPDGRMLASGSYDNQVRLWNLPNGEPVAVLRGHKAMVNCLSFSPDGSLLVTGSKDPSVLLWSLPAATRLTRLKGHRDDVSCVAISPDGRALATGSWDSTIRLWRLPDGELLDTLGATGTMDGHAGWVTCLAISPDGQVLASGGADNAIRLWSIPGGAPLKVLEEHRDRISCLAFSSDGRTLLSGSWDHRVCVWRSELARLRQLPVGRTTLQDMEWTEEVLANSKLSTSEQAWLEFLLALMRWRRRYDIKLEEASRISVGEFDIEIEG